MNERDPSHANDLAPAARLARARASIAANELEAARVELDGVGPELGDEAMIEKAYLDIRQRGLLRKGLEIARGVVARSSEDPALRARALHVLGHAQSRLRRTGRALGTLLEAARVYREVGDDLGRAHVYDTLGQVYAAQGRLDQALHYYGLSLVDKAVLGDRLGLAVTIGSIGRLHLRSGRYEDAIQCFERDLEMSKTMGDKRGEARMYEDLGRAYAGLERLDEAETSFRACLALATEHKLPELVFYAHMDLASLCLTRDDPEGAERHLDAAHATGLDREVPYFAIILQASRAELLLEQGDPEALQALERVLARHEAADLPDVEIPVRLRLARALMERGYKALAEKTLLQGLRRARRAGYTRYLPALNEAITELRVVEGALEERDRTLHRTSADASEPADGAYVPLAHLGTGAYGEVYRAWDPIRAREVALKLVHLEREYDTEKRRRQLASIRLELEAASRVRHPGVARVFAIGEEEDGGFYVVQEYVPGTSLRSILQNEQEPPVARVAQVGAKLAHALHALHEGQVVHRDLKPENVIVRDEGAPVLVDFGIAHLEVPGAPKPEAAGTLEYMAPEQARGASVDGRADLYALGVMLYEWLVGFRPLQLEGLEPEAWMRVLGTREPPRVREFRPDLPEALDHLVASLLAKKPKGRPPDAAVVARTLEGLAASDA